jgi:hypothetical protein
VSGSGREISHVQDVPERILGTHGGGTLERHIIGSAAEGILRTIHSPVLTVGPHVAVPAVRYRQGAGAAREEAATRSGAPDRSLPTPRVPG